MSSAEGEAPAGGEGAALSPEIKKRLATGFLKYDKDGDSLLSKRELHNLIEDIEEEEWDEISTDKDGFLSSEELEKFALKVQMARGAARLDVFVRDFECMEPRYSLTDEQKTTIRHLFGSPGFQKLENPLTGFKASHTAAELNMLLEGLTMLSKERGGALQASELQDAMSVFVALCRHLEAKTADGHEAERENPLVNHGQFECQAVKEMFPGDTCLCEVIANYESLTDPPELWMSECGLVLSVMQLGITDRLLQEAQASLGEVGLERAHLALDQRNPKKLSRKCTLCGLADSGCAVM